MSVGLYDLALVQKFQKWTAGTQVRLTGVNETERLFSVIADTNNDKPIQLPLIALSRPGGFIINEKYKQPKAYNSNAFQQTSRRGAVLNVIPITINYQLDVYTRYQAEADEYMRNLVFNIINYPKVTIQIPYESLGVFHDSNIRITTDVDDNSDIPQRLIAGQFTRYTLGLSIDDAYLFDVRVADNLSIVETSAEPSSTDNGLV